MHIFQHEMKIPYIAKRLGVAVKDMPSISNVEQVETRAFAFCFRKTRRIVVTTDTSLIVIISQVINNPQEVRIDLKRNRKVYKKVTTSDIGRSCYIPIDTAYLTKLVHHLAIGGNKAFGPVRWLAEIGDKRIVYSSEHQFYLIKAEFVFALNCVKNLIGKI